MDEKVRGTREVAQLPCIDKVVDTLFGAETVLERNLRLSRLPSWMLFLLLSSMSNPLSYGERGSQTKACTHRAICAEARGVPTGADFRQSCYVAAVQQRQVPMVLSVLKTFSGSAVAVHRQIRRHPCGSQRSLLCWSCWFHRCRSWRRQLATLCEGGRFPCRAGWLDPQAQVLEKTISLHGLQIVENIVEASHVGTLDL